MRRLNRCDLVAVDPAVLEGWVASPAPRTTKSVARSSKDVAGGGHRVGTRGGGGGGGGAEA